MAQHKFRPTLILLSILLASEFQVFSGPTVFGTVFFNAFLQELRPIFTTRSDRCTIFQWYVPEDSPCTTCLCFPFNWYNCWTRRGICTEQQIRRMTTTTTTLRTTTTLKTTPRPQSTTRGQ